MNKSKLPSCLRPITRVNGAKLACGIRKSPVNSEIRGIRRGRSLRLPNG